jgi:hypothetical protein
MPFTGEIEQYFFIIDAKPKGWTHGICIDARSNGKKLDEFIFKSGFKTGIILQACLSLYADKEFFSDLVRGAEPENGVDSITGIQ